ncbi:MAG: GDP-L-fucose synthase [Bacteroidales bacterium]
MNKDKRIFVAGSTGMVGSAVIRQLTKQGYTNITGSHHKRKPEKQDHVQYVKLDLLDQKAVENFFSRYKPSYVFQCAARVGGIHANNTYRARFLYENLEIQNNIIHQSYLNGVDKLLFLGSSCIYPKFCPQPMKEDYLLTGPLEHTNEPYAIAKIAGIKMCEAYRDQYGCNFISAMPTNLYGPNDNYDLENSHVLPALIRKFHEAGIRKDPVVEIWGSGAPKREFMHVDDLSGALVFLMNKYDGRAFVNVGTGQEISIKELAGIIKKITGYGGDLHFDTSKPDGTPRKLLDVSRLINHGYEPSITLEEGIKSVYEDFKENYARLIST